MGRLCKGLQLSPSQLRNLEELSTQAKNLGCYDIALRIHDLVTVSRQYTYKEVAACLGVTSGTVSNWVANFEQQGSITTTNGGPDESNENICRIQFW